MELQLPEKGFTVTEREWLQKVIDKINTNRGIQGRNVTITDDGSGQTINVNDCGPCP